jgi:hypothetical protein
MDNVCRIPICNRCRKRTFPFAWCDCDAGFQIDEYLNGEIVYLQSELAEKELKDLSP